MTHTHNKQAASLLAHLESQQAQLSTTIAYLRSMVGSTNGNGADNGHGLVRYPGVTGPIEKDPVRIVAKARARFHARRPKPQRRWTPAQWIEKIAQVLAAADGPMKAPEIGQALGSLSTTVYQHVNAAVKAGAIVALKGAGKHGKPFSYVVAPTRHAKGTTRKKSGPKLRAQRTKSLKILERFDQTEARPWPGHPGKIGQLISRGYLTRTPDGYLRTNKEYQVNPA